MADVSKIKLPNGTELNIKDKSSGYVDSAGAASAAPVQSVNGQTGDVTVQPTLVSGTNIKTINNTSILGSGNISVATTDTKNTAGSTNSASKLYLIGAESQATNPQTYSNGNLYFDSGLNASASGDDYTSSIEQSTNQIRLDVSYDYEDVEYSYSESSNSFLRIRHNDVGLNSSRYTSEGGQESTYLNVASSGISMGGTGTYLSYINVSGEYGIEISGGPVTITDVVTPTNNTDAANKQYVDGQVATKQDTLVSGTNIKTINNESLLGSGNIAISSTDVQINGTSITSNGVANIVTNTAYNASTNKIATMADVNASITSTDDGAGNVVLEGVDASSSTPITGISMNGTLLGTSGVINIPAASNSSDGVITTGNQTFTGNKTFSNVIASSVTANSLEVQADINHYMDIYTVVNSSDVTLAYFDICNSNTGNMDRYFLPVLTNTSGNYSIITTKNLTDIPDASATQRGLVSTSTQTFIGDKTFAKSGSSGVTTLTIQGPISDSGIGAGVLTLKANYGGGETVTHSIKDDGDYRLQFSTYTTNYALSGGHSGDYYIAYNLQSVTTSSSTVPVYFSDNEGALTACSGVVVTTGKQTFTGKKIFNGDDFTIGNSDDFPTIILEDTSNVASLGSVQFYNVGARLEIQQYSGRNRTGVMETFSLPITLSTDTQTNYNILTTKNLDDIPDASATQRGLVSTGSQTFAGSKTFKAASLRLDGTSSNGGLFTVSGAGLGPAIYLNLRDSSSSSSIHTYWIDTGTVSGGGFSFYEQDDSDPDNKYEEYYLPTVTGVGTYKILTSKNTKTVTASLTVAGWTTSHTQTVTVTGMTASANIVVSAAPASEVNYRHSGVYCSAQAANTLTFTCTTNPTSALTVQILMIG